MVKIFEFKIDDEIKYMYFFKGKSECNTDEIFDEDDLINKPKGFIKKNYIYVRQDETLPVKQRLVIKNLGIKKKSNSPLSRKIFWDYIAPRMCNGEQYISKTFVKNKIKELLKEDIMLIAMRKSVSNPEGYASKTSQSYQIAQTYGSGIHFLIPNTRNLGIGKGKKFCTIEEFKKHNCTVDDIDTEGVLKELNYFIKDLSVKTLFDF